MSRYRYLTANSASLFSAFTTTISGAASSTFIRVINSDNTVTEIVGTGLTLSGLVATGGTITSITRLTSIGGTTIDVLDLPSAGADSFVSFWNAGSGAARRDYALGLGDSITGSTGADALYGEGGDDTIFGGDGNDWIYGDNGADSLDGGNGDDQFFGGGGSDTFNGGAGFDLVLNRLTSGETTAIFANLNNVAVTVNGNTRAAFTGNDAFGNIEGYVSIEGVEGSGFNDTLVGGAEGNWFRGSAGNDTIIGNGGFDELTHQQITLGPDGTAPGSVLNGILVTFSGGGNGTVNNDGFGGVDAFFSIEVVRGTELNDTVIGDASDNSFRGLKGNDSFDGGDGTDQVDYSSDDNAFFGGTFGSAPITVDLAAGTGTDGWGNTDTFASVEWARGADNNDTLSGNAVANRLWGQGGNDLLNGVGGDDTLDGENGNDTLNGGDGTDTLLSSAGIDTFNGGAAGLNGGDWVNYSVDFNLGGTGAVTVNLATGTGTDGFGNVETLTGIENIIGTGGNDVMTGNAVSNSFNGLNGNDSFVGGRGADFFTPGAGNDTFDGSNTGGLDGAGFDNDTISYHNIGATAGLDANFNTGLIQKTINNVAFTDTVIDVERIRGTAFGDNMRGSDTANFRQERFEGLNGADTMNGGAGSDLVRYDNDQRFGGGSVGVTVRFDLGTAVDGFGATDIISNIEGVIGTRFADFIQGDGSRNFLRVTDGNDTFNGAAGNDQVQMYFDDSIGGAGAVVELWANRAFTLTGAQVTLSSVEDAVGSYRNDTLVGDGGENQLNGDLGNDLIFGGAGRDLMGGGPGQDTLNGEGGFDIAVYNFDPADGVDFAADVAITDPTFNWGLQNWNWTGINLNLVNGTATGWDGATDTLIDIEGAVGTFFNDTLVGNALDNEFWGLAGNDSIAGGLGVDTVHYDTWTAFGRLFVLNGVTTTVSSGINVNLLTGQANDGAGGTDTLSGIENVVATLGNDNVFGSLDQNLFVLDAGNDTGNGAGGDDVIFGWLGNDLLFGGDGNDNLVGEQDNDTLVAEAGNDTMDGGDGDDLMYGWFGNDLMFGGLGADTFFGEQDNDVIVALEGNDTGFGGDGDDVAFGWLGSDELWGGTGNDQLFGEQDNDVLLGEDGSDTLFGGDGADTAYGWVGVDVLWGGDGNDVLFGEQDNDVVLGETGNDVLLGGEGQDSLYGWVGNDSLYGWVGDDLLLGEDGDDFMLGEDGNDTLNGGAGNDFLGGQSGDDLLLGFDGADVFFGDDGNDFLGGLAGNDTMVAGAGSDTMWGDAGDDLFVFRAADLGNAMADVVNSFGEAAGNFDLIRFEGVAQANVAISQQGADTLLTFIGSTASIRVVGFSAAAIGDQLIFA